MTMTDADTRTTSKPSISFITLTNNGYIDYTLNCLKSLEKVNSPILPVCYCLGEQAHKTLQEHGYESVLLPNDSSNDSSEFQSFKSNAWHKITFKKIEVIYLNLVKYKYVLYTDGDIIFNNPEFYKYIIEHMGQNDLFIQNDTELDNSNKVLCTGFMFIKSNPRTLKLFNPKQIIKHAMNSKWDDQAYINSIKRYLKFSKLPLDLFPNGQYYYKNSDKLTPMIVHFNWVIGHVKKDKMQEYGKWYLEDTSAPL